MFSKLINNKYKVKFPDFFIYFNKYYINGKIFDKRIWNYINSIVNNVENSVFFILII